MLSHDSPSSDRDRDRRRAEHRRRARAAARKALDTFLDEMYGPEIVVAVTTPDSAFLRTEAERGACGPACLRLHGAEHTHGDVMHDGTWSVQHNRHYGACPEHGAYLHSDSCPFGCEPRCEGDQNYPPHAAGTVPRCPQCGDQV